MGLIKGLLSKQYCSLCGEQAKMFSRSALADGMLCGKCKSKLSPYYTGVKKRSTADVKRHIAYRTFNREMLQSFRVSRTLTTDMENIYLDEKQKLFCISQKTPDASGNPDLIPIRCIRSCETDVVESEKELTHYDSEKQSHVSYNPPRYEYRRSIFLRLSLQGHEWLTGFSVRCGEYTFQNRPPVTFDQMLKKAEGICEELMRIKAGPAPQRSRICPHCGATTVPDAQGRCEYCMSAIGE